MTLELGPEGLQRWLFGQPTQRAPARKKVLRPTFVVGGAAWGLLRLPVLVILASTLIPGWLHCCPVVGFDGHHVVSCYLRHPV